MERNQIYFVEENLLVKTRSFVFCGVLWKFDEPYATEPPYTAPGDGNGPFKLGATRGAEDGHPRIEVITVMWRVDSRRGRCFLVDINNIKVVL